MHQNEIWAVFAGSVGDKVRRRHRRQHPSQRSFGRPPWSTARRSLRVVTNISTTSESCCRESYMQDARAEMVEGFRLPTLASHGP